jgi:hypothetical protein
MTGEDLTVGDGGWVRSWVVIGWDEDLGHPLFVDIANPTSPVFPSAHGTGEWRPHRVARNVRSLLRTRQ